MARLFPGPRLEFPALDDVERVTLVGLTAAAERRAA